MKIAIIGAGRIGKALQFLASKNSENNIAIWDVDSARLEVPLTLAEVVGGSDLVLICTSTANLQDAARSCRAHVGSETVIISFSKGLERQTLKTGDVILAEEFPNNPIGVAGGPLMAEELLAGGAGVAVVGSADKRVFEIMKKFFVGTGVFVITETDARTVSLGGVLKNIYALGLGIARALEWDENLRGWLTAVMIEEMVLLATRLGCSEKIIRGPAGVGDFILTGFSEHSRNAITGAALVTGSPCDVKGDGFYAVPAVVELVQKDTAAFPILTALGKIVIDCADAKKIFSSILPL